MTSAEKREAVTRLLDTQESEGISNREIARRSGTSEYLVRVLRSEKPRGRVYFIQAEHGGPVKIGWSIRPATRLVMAQVYSPYRLRIIGTITGTAALERELHQRFAAHRMCGEWFEPAPALLALARGEV